MQEKDFNKIEVQNNICINVFGYENKLVSISDQTRRVAKGWGGGGGGREGRTPPLPDLNKSSLS